MDIATGAMKTLLPKLGELLLGEFKLQKGVKGEIEVLKEELSSMNAALCKVSEVPAEQLDEVTKIWARDVRELSYDIEDAVDTFILQGMGQEPAKTFGFKGFIDRTINLLKKAMSNHQHHGVIKDIMKQVNMVNKRHKRYKVSDVATRGPIISTVDPRLEAMFTKATELIGIDGPKNELAKILVDEGSSSGQQPMIISIVGCGGLGKTTLANALLHDLKTKFDCQVFVSVSHNPDIKTILKNILGQLDEYANINEAWDVVQLINKIIKLHENKRFLCVIDDVWNEWAWDTVKFALQDAKHGSKIVITTRNKAVAEHAGGVVYELKPLSVDASRKLFNKRIFDIEDGCPPGLREVAGNILKKCDGVPLAIITTASLLASKPRHTREWENVNNSIGFGLEKSPAVEKMKNILNLSYNDLPFHLKTCLLSLSKYPEDKKIRKDVLIWSWIAEGFITEETRPAGTSLQVIGESYFIELINRSLIQPADIVDNDFHDGEVHACQVHDMVLELINQLSAEEGFVTTLLPDGQQAGTRTSAPQKKKIRRLSLHYSNRSYASPEEIAHLSRVRSFAVFGDVDSIPPLSSFHVLRVLQLEDCSGLDNNHLNDLGELRHLMFLQLWRYSATRLPESIGKLESLATLDIRYARSSVVMLPMSSIKLQKLVRLFANRVRLPDGLALGNMRSLRELVAIDFTPEVIEEIGNLKELRVLRIVVNYPDMEDGTRNSWEHFLLSLQRCTNLQDLFIETNVTTECSLDSMQYVPSSLQRFMSSGILMMAFPRWINSVTLSSLNTLSIQLCLDLLPHHLEMLAELPSLRFLRLWSAGIWKLQKLSIPSSACSFRCLRHFYFYSSWMILTFQPGAMPELQRLCLCFDPRLDRNNLDDLGLKNLHSLRHIVIKFLSVEPEDRQEAEAAIREDLKHSPNHPSLELLFLG
ncbi:unnamed protein product [Urochloa decumbens]|uniref:AAA+ ATPase domain-containing protein n=1 Tax=Urochloa decumbens TaxID=240449 RepID=A0ABC9EZM0_9POAL